MITFIISLLNYNVLKSSLITPVNTIIIICSYRSDVLHQPFQQRTRRNHLRCCFCMCSTEVPLPTPPKVIPLSLPGNTLQPAYRTLRYLAPLHQLVFHLPLHLRLILQPLSHRVPNPVEAYEHLLIGLTKND